MTPPAPQRRPQQRRYSSALVALARRMYGDGDAWTPTQIRDYIAEHHDAPGLHVGTVRRWVLPSEADEQRRLNSRSYRRRAGHEQAVVVALPDPEPIARFDLDAQMLLLRERRLSYGAIATIVALYHDVEMTDEQVRYRLHKLGVEKNPRKVRAARRAHVRAA